MISVDTKLNAAYVGNVLVWYSDRPLSSVLLTTGI